MLPLLRFSDRDPVVLRMSRDLVRTLKRGHPWVYADGIRQLPSALPGVLAILLDNKHGREVARGIYDPHCPIAFRVCELDGKPLQDTWAEQRFGRAIDWRRRLFTSETTGYRLLNGEGDQVPGLVVDVYGKYAVMQLDGAGPAGFWHAQGIATHLARRLELEGVWLRARDRSAAGELLWGHLPPGDVAEFQEHGVHWTADLVRGQKTGFFLDQRENRNLIRGLSTGQTVLNLFAYTGGFSVAAGLGGASHVTSVDLSKPAMAMAETHWTSNGLRPESHAGVAGDVFEFLSAASSEKRTWDVVICDPPSFAPSESAVPQAEAAYRKLIAASARVTRRGGLLATSSCSSHLPESSFLEINQEALSEAKRRGTVRHISGQPADHPSPLVCPEFRYLKFVLMRVD